MVSIMKQWWSAFLAFLFSMLALPALAQTDEAVTAITAQSTRGVAIAAAFLAMGIAIWAGMYIYRKFFK